MGLRALDKVNDEYFCGKDKIVRENEITNNFLIKIDYLIIILWSHQFT